MYVFLRLLFGLSGLPGTFQHLMDRVLRGLPFAMVYIDDILIYSEIEKNHKQHLKQVLQRHYTAKSVALAFNQFLT